MEEDECGRTYCACVQDDYGEVHEVCGELLYICGDGATWDLDEHEIDAWRDGEGSPCDAEWLPEEDAIRQAAAMICAERGVAYDDDIADAIFREYLEEKE